MIIWYTLWLFNISMENHNFWWINSRSLAIFNSYVCLPEADPFFSHTWIDSICPRKSRKTKNPSERVWNLRNNSNIYTHTLFFVLQAFYMFFLHISVWVFCFWLCIPLPPPPPPPHSPLTHNTSSHIHNSHHLRTQSHLTQLISHNSSHTHNLTHTHTQLISHNSSHT